MKKTLLLMPWQKSFTEQGKLAPGMVPTGKFFIFADIFVIVGK